MRAHRLATLSFFALLLACQGEEPGGVEASVVSSTITATPGTPDGLANLDVSIELQGRGQPEEVTLADVMLTAQPVTDSSDTLTFSAEMRNTMGDDPVVRIAKGQTLIARVRNTGTTNAQVEAWCDTPAELSVTVETDDGESATATANVTVRCS